MESRTLTTRGFITLVLVLQFVPLVLYPPSMLAAFDEGVWLGFSLAVMALIAVLTLLSGRARNLWPWYLLGFCHGFNIIGRLMTVWPNVTTSAGAANTLYLLLTALAMVLSAGFLWYNELPDVRTRLARVNQ